MLNTVRFRGAGVISRIQDERSDEVHAHRVVVGTGHREGRVANLHDMGHQSGLVLEAFVVLIHRITVRGVRLQKHVPALQVLLTGKQVVVVLVQQSVDTVLHGRTLFLRGGPELVTGIRLGIVHESSGSGTD